MSRSKTIGYIVVDGIGRPMLWDESCKRFFLFNRKSATVFPSGSYSYVRGRVQMHVRTVRGFYYVPEDRKAYTDLKIVALIDPLKYEWR